MRNKIKKDVKLKITKLADNIAKKKKATKKKLTHDFVIYNDRIEFMLGKNIPRLNSFSGLGNKDIIFAKLQSYRVIFADLPEDKTWFPRQSCNDKKYCKKTAIKFDSPKFDASIFYKSKQNTIKLNGKQVNGSESRIKIDNLIKGNFIHLEMLNRNIIKKYGIRRSYLVKKPPNVGFVNSPWYINIKNPVYSKKLFILDYNGGNEIFTLQNITGEKYFIQTGSGMEDVRRIDSINMINQTQAIIKIKEYYFTFDFQKLKESTINGIGSFCKYMTYKKLYDAKSIFICSISQSEVKAIYLSDRNKITQTALSFNMNDKVGAW